MKFLCKLFGCESKTVIKEVVKEVPVEVVKEVIKEVPVEVVKEITVGSKQSYPQKPERPVLSGTPREQYIQIYEHYRYTKPAQAYIDYLGDQLNPQYIELILELIDVINGKTIEYMNRPAFDVEVKHVLATANTDMLRRVIEERKDRGRLGYVEDALRNDLPLCGCEAA